MNKTARPRPIDTAVTQVAGNTGALTTATGLRLLAAGRYTMRDHRASRAKAQPTWLVELLLHGEMQFRVMDRPWQTYRRGCGQLYAPHTPYQERITRPGAACESVGLLFDIGDTPQLNHWRSLTPSYRHLDDPQEHLTHLAERVLSHLGAGNAGDLLAHGCFLQLIGQLLQSEGPGDRWTITPDRPENDLLTRTHRFMHDHLARPLRISDMAQHTGLTDSGFAHAYKRLTGESPMTALRRRRIEAVKFHLYSNRHVLADIAELTGFTDAFHLSRTFKQYVGVSPREFRARFSRASKQAMRRQADQ